MVKLSDEQVDALFSMKNGCILCGGVGSGKTRTSLAYYLFRVCDGTVPMNGDGVFHRMNHPRDLYVITTAKKRDEKDWEIEAADFLITKDPITSHSGIKMIVDSWNNIQKYREVTGAFFIFDEQRVVGSGAWVKAFLDIARKNQWVLLSATPGDQWTDYIPVFVANGFYRNRTEFLTRHAVYARNLKFPKIDRFVGEDLLEEYRRRILVNIYYKRNVKRHNIDRICDYNYDEYRKILTERWDPYDNCPIQEGGKFIYLLRKCVNQDPSRLRALRTIAEEKKRIIVFYNYIYELKMILEYFDGADVSIAQWNGQKHEACPIGDRWIYLVQYSAGCEGWNCITTDTIVFFSQTYSYKIMEQASGRIDRRNTPFDDLYYYHFRSRASIDNAIKKKLSDKKQFNEKAFYGKFGF